MHGFPLAPLVAFALTFGLVGAAPPALAQVVAAPPVDTPSAGTSATNASAGEAQPVDTPSAGMSAANGLASEAQPVEPPSGDNTSADKSSAVAAQMADWVVASGDNGGRPFVIVDKMAATVLVFDADGRLQGQASVLVGLARGDDSAPGVGDRELSAIPPEERTTPAGRFLAAFGPASGHRTVLWVDWADAISLHPVVTSNPKEHRLERLRSPEPGDRRITFGCINVPADFYADVVLKAFAGGSGVVYVLPDTKPLEEVFPAFARLERTSAVANDAARSTGSPPPAAEPASPMAAGDPGAVSDPAAQPLAEPASVAAEPPAR